MEKEESIKPKNIMKKEEAIKQLKESPMLYLSSGSKELFHSNFLYWLGVNYRDAFKEVMTRLCEIHSPWPENWTVRREYLHLDLCVTYEKETGKKSKGKAVTKEWVFIVVENKVKSLPDKMQLWRYANQLFEERNTGCSYVVLSLIKEFPVKKDLDKTCWKPHHYDELAKHIRDVFANNAETEHKVYINDYCSYIESLDALAKEWTVNKKDRFLSQDKDLVELRLNDAYEKVRYAQIAALLAEDLKSMSWPASEEERIILGMSNTNVILKRKRNNADEILKFYGCPNAKPYGQVFIGSGMAHAVGFVEAKVKIADDCCLVIQVQGNHHCHAIEKENIWNEQNQLDEKQNDFLNFSNAAHVSDLCRYGTGFIYKWEKIQEEDTIGDVVKKFTDKP